MPTSYEVIFLGNLAKIDTTQGNESVENAAGILGSYGTSSDPLASHVHNLTADRLSEDDNDSYDTDNGGGYDRFKIDGGAAQNFDAVATYNATITYADGTTANITATVFQDVDGNTYLAPEETNNADQVALTAQPIQSLDLNSVSFASGDMEGTRIAGDFIEAVDGTSGNDYMPIGYTDADGDQIDGSDGNDDYILGGAGDDNINFGYGNDTVYGGDGNDIIDDVSGTNYAGDDLLFGDAGNDSIWGGDGADTIDGGADNDLIDGEIGDDSMFGGSGADNISGGDGNDTADGGSGNDTISGGSGADSLLGNSGDDSLDGGAGDDTISGGDGDDTIVGGSGADLLSGNDGADSFNLGDGFASDTIVGGEGGTDSDSIDLSSLSSPVNVSYSGDEEGTINDGADTLSFSEIENIFATSGSDTIDGSEDTSGLTIFADGGSDLVDGGTGADFLDGAAGADTLIGGGGADTLLGGSGDDVLVGDEIVSSKFSYEFYELNGTSPSWLADAGFSTGPDNDGPPDSVGYTDTINVGSIDAAHGGDASTFAVKLSTTLTVTSGGSYTFETTSDDGSKLFVDGVEVVDNDGLQGATSDSGSISLSAGEHLIEIIYFENSGDEVLSSSVSGPDTGGTPVSLETAAVAAPSIAGEGNDVIDGGSGSDTITGGLGDDSLTGGNGDDTFVYSAGDGDDTISDFNTGNTGTLGDGDSTNNDAIDLSGFYDNLSELYSDQADDGILNQSNTTDIKGRAVDYSDNDNFGDGSLMFTGASADNSSFTQENTGVVCFASGTAIRTPTGDVLIENLRLGDLVTTMDNGPQKIRWISRRNYTQSQMQTHPNLLPVFIQKGVLGAERDLLVSQQHGIMIGRHEEYFTRAKHLVPVTTGIRIAHGRRYMSYIHLMFDAHQVIFAENVASESFYPGPMALDIMDVLERKRFGRVLPLACGPTFEMEHVISIYGSPARNFIRL